LALFVLPATTSDLLQWIWLITWVLFALILILAGVDGLVPDVIPEDVTKYLLWIGVIVFAVYYILVGIGGPPLDIVI
jgi:hypothetical protein